MFSQIWALDTLYNTDTLAHGVLYSIYCRAVACKSIIWEIGSELTNLVPAPKSLSFVIVHRDWMEGCELYCQVLKWLQKNISVYEGKMRLTETEGRVTSVLSGGDQMAAYLKLWAAHRCIVFALWGLCLLIIKEIGVDLSEDNVCCESVQ